MWYGLYINGECWFAARFDSKPTVFDFNIPIIASSVYEVITVDVIARFYETRY